jgi:prophage regulatory protein
MSAPAPPGRILGIADVQRETSFSRTTIWRRIRDGNFPKPIPLGGRRVGWPEREIEAWKAKLIASSH